MLPRNMLALSTNGAGRVVAAMSASYFCRCVILLGVEEEEGSSPFAEGADEEVKEGPGFVGVWWVLPTTSDRGAGGAYVGYESDSEWIRPSGG